MHIIEIAMSMRRRGVERRLIIKGPAESPARFDRPLIDTVARAHIYLAALNDGQGRNRKQIAEAFGVHAEDISRILPLAFLSPRLLDAILTGRQPADLSVARLTREIDLPVSWTAQADQLAV